MNTLMDQTLRTLEAKSKKALKTAKKQLLQDKIKNEKLQRALEYYAENWEDTLHPGIIATSCESVGGKSEDSLPMQVAMLFLTAAIDIHDDIIDESKVKNGKPTVFGKFGSDLALLVGDGMLMKGMAMIARYGEKNPAKLVDIVLSTVENGFTEAGIAHALESSFKGKTDLDPEYYLDVLKKKAAILEAHARIGALAGNGTENEVDSLGEYGRVLGALILLRDEFVDVFEAQELGNRVKKGCLPLPLLYAFKNPRIKEKVLSILSKPKVLGEDAEEIVEIVLAEKSTDAIRKEMKNLIKKAEKAIGNLEQKGNLERFLTATLEGI